MIALGQSKALLVDDSLTVRMDLREALEEASFQVLAADSLAEARTHLAATKFDVIILDVFLPDGDGIELLTEIRRGISNTVPVILLSSESDVRERVRGLTTGANAYIAKPYDTRLLIERARSLIHQQSHDAARAAQRTVLLIDDSLTFRDALQGALESTGYRVVTAGTGEEGLRAAAEIHPSAVIVDGIMPGIDGATVVRRLRMDATLRRTPCLVLTGSEAATDELGALEAGADAYVRKTGEMQLILARLAAVVRRSSEGGAVEPEHSLVAKKILAIDDSTDWLDLLELELKSEGYDVRLAHSGTRALEILADEAMDCIILDRRMPGMTGEDVCRRVKLSPAWRDIPLIMMSALNDRDAMLGGIDAGADDFIAKSGSLEVLKARVRAQLRRRQFEEENRHIREELLRREIEAKDSRAQRELAETRAALLGDLEKKNEELARINQKLERAKRQAERESLFKSRFLANMSHELRTPLNAIIGFSELLAEESFGPLNGKQGEYVNHVHASGHHLLTLINDILDISKIEANKFELRREWLPLMSSIDAAWVVVTPLAEKRSVTLELGLEVDLPMLLIDPVRIKQVLYNLLSNGIKFTPAGGKVRLSARAAGEQVEITVEDSGIGIAPEDMSRLFREFEQIESAVAKKQEGTGLGLALTRKLVELHGGTVTVRSELGKGTAFTVHLPLLRAPSDQASMPASDNGPPESLVLVVEDDPQAADLIAGHLRAAGLSVAFAQTADEALKLAQELKPAAITLDALMPNVDGWQTLSKLKETPGLEKIPVVIISVVDHTNRGLVLGANDYLLKPVSREALLNSLESAGVPVTSVMGMRVLLISDNGNGIEGHLRHAGCVVRRGASLTDKALLEPDPVDVVIVDSNEEPPGTRKIEAIADGRRIAIPVLHVFDATQVDVTGWRTQLEALGRDDAHQPERLVRAVRRAVDQRHSATPMENKPVAAHLRMAVHRAQRESARVALLGIRLSAPVHEDGLAAVRKFLRPGDFMDVIGERSLALVAYGITGDAQRLAQRLVELLKDRAILQVDDHCVLSFPDDSTHADELFDRVLEKLAIA